MNIHLILSHLYEGHIYHAYLNSLWVSKKNGDAIITHQSYIDKELQYQEQYFEVFEMEEVSEEEKKKISQYGIPDDYYERIIDEYGSKTEAYAHLFTERDLEFENYLCDAISKIDKEDIKKFYIFGETYESVRCIAKQYGIEIVNYEFSTVRKVSGYTCNLMHAYTAGRLYGHDQLIERYKCFCDEIKDDDLLSREELIAIFVPERQLPLLPLLYSKPKYEIGILRIAWGIVLSFSGNFNATDDDVWVKCRKYYSREEIIKRNHPGDGVENEIIRYTMEKDTLPFILSCKRIVSISSNGLFEAMLWNRTACILSDAMAFYFMCEHDWKSEEVVPIKFLNFYLFCALVPLQEFLFDSKYWEKRKITTEKQLFHDNLSNVLKQLEIDESILKYKGSMRLKKILEIRNINESLIETICTSKIINPVKYDCLESELYIVNKENQKKQYRCINYSEGYNIISCFEINDYVQNIEFVPYTDKAGMCIVKNIICDEVEEWAGNGELNFIEKGEHKAINCRLLKRVNVLKIVWEAKNISITSIKQVIEQREGIKEELEKAYSSYSWKLSRPARSIMKLCKLIFKREK